MEPISTAAELCDTLSRLFVTHQNPVFVRTYRLNGKGCNTLHRWRGDYIFVSVFQHHYELDTQNSGVDAEAINFLHKQACCAVVLEKGEGNKMNEKANNHEPGNLQQVDVFADEKDDKVDKLTAPPSPEQVRRTVIISLSVCSFYILVSSSMVFANKALSYTYKFQTTNFLLLCQMCFTAILLRSLRSLGIIDFVDFQLSKARQVAPISVFYSLNAAVALVALRELSVPSYTLIKRLAPLFTISLEAVLLKKLATKAIFGSLLVMSAGTVLAANADTSSSTFAWLLGFLSCAFQALYLVFVKRSGSETSMNSFGILYYHSILSLPCISLIAIAVGEITPALNFPSWTSSSFLAVFISSLFMGFLLNYALFLCTELTSPTSTVVSGQVKAMGQTAIGMFTFGGVDMNGRYLLGTILNISGGFGYAYAKLKAIRERS